MKTVTTPKGTTLPLTNLKGKDYLMVAYRIQWMNEEVPNFNIKTEFPLLNDEQTVCTATIELMDKDLKVTKKASGTKRETKKDFSDHTEKAETSAIGRALAILGFGTQFAVADLDEGQRIADSPLADPNSGKKLDAAPKNKWETPSDTKAVEKVKVTKTSEVEEEW